MATPYSPSLSIRLWRLGKRVWNAILGRFVVVLVRLVRVIDPDRLADRCGRSLRRFGPWLPEHRVGRANLVAAFPEKSPEEIERILAGVWENLGRLGAEFVHLDHIWDYDPANQPGGRIIVPPDSVVRFAQLRDDGKPALLFAAHLANWELPAIGAAAHGLETAVLYRPPSVRDIDRIVLGFRSLNMGMLIPSGLDAPVRMARALEQGVHVGMLADQYSMQGVDVTFFGRRTKANPLIAKLAQHTSCPIHGARAIRLPEHRFICEVTDAIAPARDAAGNIDIAGTMQVITSVIEGWVREYPEQWLWLHRRWR